MVIINYALWPEKISLLGMTTYDDPRFATDEEEDDDACGAEAGQGAGKCPRWSIEWHRLGLEGGGWVHDGPCPCMVNNGLVTSILLPPSGGWMMASMCHGR